MERYRHFNTFLKEKFGQRVLKICIDGGFSCPNRDGKCGTKGCVFCGERGSGENIKHNNSIPAQVENYLNSYKAQRANKFIAYFQNFSNTYAPVSELKEKYDSALISDKIVALAIATRPDCIDEEKAKLIASYKSKYYVWVELGFQTSNELIAKSFNRGYDNKVFEDAVALLRKYDIDVVTHMMIGLPNQKFDDVKSTVQYLNNFDIQGLKIHSTYIIQNTQLEQLWKENLYTPLTIEDYVSCVVYIISHLRSDIVIHRITGDPPKDILVEPTWQNHKKIVLNKIEKSLVNNNITQGCYLHD